MRSLGDHHILTCILPSIFSIVYIGQNTANRQDHLYHGKYFRCRCIRCGDPTELGTNLGSIKCELCTDGLLIPIAGVGEWQCQSCDAQTDAIHAQRLIRECQQAAHATTTNIDDIEACIQIYQPKLNSNHSIIIEMKQKLIASIRQTLEVNPTVVNCIALHKRKIEICKELHSLLYVLQPGLSRIRAVVLYEHFTSLYKLIKTMAAKVDVRNFELLVSAIQRWPNIIPSTQYYVFVIFLCLPGKIDGSRINNCCCHQNSDFRTN